MPSQYEPCGLTQMRAQRYGTIPIARRVGGLADTIEDGVTGFLFDDYTPADFTRAVARAIDQFEEPDGWLEMMREAMTRDFGWEQSANKYLNVYRRVVGHGADGALTRRRAARLIGASPTTTAELVTSTLGFHRQPEVRASYLARTSSSESVTGSACGVGTRCGGESSARSDQRSTKDCRRNSERSPVTSFALEVHHGLSLDPPCGDDR